MKNKKILFITLGALLMAGCDPTVTPSSSQNTQSSPTTSSTTNPSSSVSSSDSGTSDSSSQTPTVNHVDPLVKEIENPSKTRKYDEDFDLMVDDFSGETLLGTNDNGTQLGGHLRVLVDSKNDDFPGSPDGAIYKMAKKTEDLESYDGIGFRIRKVGTGVLDYSNLVLGLRGNDAYKVFDLSLTDALDPDGEALPSLTEEYQDVIISPMNSIEDENTEYVYSNGDKTGTKVLNKIVGFHLYATGECSQMIEIEEVFAMKAGQKTVLDTFDRTDINAASELAWWNGSTGLIVRKGIELNNGASYTTKSSDDVANYENVVLNVLGDTSGATLTPITSSGEGTAIGWASLKDADNNPVSQAVNGAYYPLAINLENSGITATDVKGFKVTSTKDLYISEIFATSFEEPEAVTELPHLDSANAVIFDDFNRTQSSIANNYDAGTAAADSIVNEAGLNHVVSWNNASMVKVANGVLTFDATNLAAEDYIQLTEGSKVARTNEKYMVISYKLEDGATLDNFRFSGGGSDTIYYNDLYAAVGLKTNTENSPYVTADGFTWAVIDLELSNLGKIKDEINFYYSGTGKLHIDSVFFANEYGTEEKVSLISEEATATFTNLETGYGYVYGGFYPGSGRYYFKVKGDGVAALDSFRLEYNGSTIYANNGLKIYNEDGTAYDYTVALPVEETTLYVDLVESGFEMGVAAHIHLHFGQDANGTSGAITFIDRGYTYIPTYAKTVGEPGSASFTNSPETGYGYFYGGYISGNCGRIAITLKGDGSAALDSFRLQYNGSTIYANNGLKIYNEDGTAYDYTAVLPEEEVTLYIDLVESGFTMGVADHMHFHFGQDANGTSGTITISLVQEVAESIPYAEVMSSLATRVVPESEEPAE